MFHWRKQFPLFVVIFGLLVAQGAFAQGNDPCLGMQSQGEMNACAADQYAKTNAELTAVYKQLISKYESVAAFQAKLRLAQESWLKFRDADVTCFYYRKDKLAAYGSAYPVCRYRAMTHLTVERTKELKRMLNPEEGDVCAFETAPEPTQEGKLQK